jgi:Fe-S-cluster-containing dehydrogenase component/FixJ family two-component response regulator
MLNTAKEKILVVDDEPMICKSCKEILEDEGYNVDLAYSGLEGVKKALDNVFDLAIVDMKMPDLSGMALLKRIRGERLNTPVVIITAYSTVDTAIEAMKLGAADYIPKPFTPNELSEVVKSVISGDTTLAQRFTTGELISKETVMKALEQEGPQAQYTMAVDIDKCIGCQMCMVDCAAHHAETREPISYPQAWKLLSESRLFVDLEGPVPVPLLCKQCENAPCATVCPTEAIQVDKDYGFKVLDKDRCIGCKSCLLVCPFGLISMDAHGRAAQKCDMCMERLERGYDPVCVQVCPRNALSLQKIPEAVTDARKRAVEQMLRSNEERKQILKLIK